MKKIQFLSVFAFCLLLISCGPNAEQKAATQKHHDDSIAQVAAQSAQQQQQQIDAAKQQHEAVVEKHRDDSIVRAAAQNAQQHDADVTNLRACQQQLESRIADLQVARNQLSEIQGFRIGRTEAEKNSQIRSKTLEIEHIQDNINSLQTNISQIKARLGQ